MKLYHLFPNPCCRKKSPLEVRITKEQIKKLAKYCTYDLDLALRLHDYLLYYIYLSLTFLQVMQETFYSLKLI